MSDGQEQSQAITESSPFWVDDWQIDPGSCRIQRGEDNVKVEPKVMSVLVCLAKQAGQVISREQLEQQAWPGLVVGYDSLASAIIKLRKAFGDNSKNPRVIETVSKKGYRLIANVSLDNKPPLYSAALNNHNETRPQKVSNLMAQVVISFLVILAVWSVIKYTTPSTSSNNKPVIAVLPFKNLSDDPRQDYFSDGITADLITDLSKLSGLSVIARNTVFHYRGADVDIKKIGKELNVNYVIEGSIRKVGDRLRISARLIDASNSHNLWADRIDGALENIFALQDEVTTKIITSLQVQLTEKERTQLAHKYTDSIEAYDLFLRGWQNLWIASKDTNPVARDYFTKAIELDKSFARAYANLALTYIYDYMNGWSEQASQSLERANYFSNRAIELDQNLPQVHWVRGFAETFNKNYKSALVEAEKAIELDPNFADGYGLLATVLNYAGRPEQAAIEMQHAMRLNPGHPAIYKVIYGEILFNQHNYDAARENFELALKRNPESQEARLWLAAAYAQLGRVDDANWQLEHIRTANAEISLAWIEKALPLHDPAQRQNLIDALTRAGLNK